MTELLSTSPTAFKPRAGAAVPINAPPLVRLLRMDPDLGDGLAPADFEDAERRVLAADIVVQPGTWTVGPERPCGVLTLLVLDGFLIRAVDRAEGRFSHVLGPGAAFDPWVATAATGTVSWTALSRTRLAVVDERVGRAAAAWPSLLAALMRRMAEWSEHLADVGVTTRLPRVDQRVLGFLWLLADRWGHVVPEGVVLDLPLTHAVLGDLVGARRSTVTLALHALAESGALRRRDGGSWLLSAEGRAFTVPPAATGRFTPEPVPTAVLAARAARSRIRAVEAGARASEAAERSAQLHDDLAAMAEEHGHAAQAARHRAWAAHVRLRAQEHAARRTGEQVAQA